MRLQWKLISNKIQDKIKIRESGIEFVLKQANIRDGSGELELAVVSGRHSEVNAEETGGEEEEDAEKGGEFPSSEGEPLGF